MGQHVRYYWSDETGAPVLNNTTGSLVALLDAVLVNGFNTKTITSLSVSGEVATAVCTAHGYGTATSEFDNDLTIAGSDTALLNGRKDVTIIDANTYTFPAPGVGDLTATGTITSKRTPLGWEKVYAGTNKAMYRSLDPATSGCLLRIDDSAGGYFSRVIGVESATDVDTYTDKFPLETQMAGGYWWSKGANTATAKSWCIVGDSLMFYYIPQSPYITYHGWCFFGDFISYRPADNYNCVITGCTSAPLNYNNVGCNVTPGSWASMATSYTTNFFMCRSYNALAKSVECNMVLPQNAASTTFQAFNPSPINNGILFLENTFLREYNLSYLHPTRGIQPGISAIVSASSHIPILPYRKLYTTTDSAQKKFLVFNIEHNSSTNSLFTIRVNGNWRA